MCLRVPIIDSVSFELVSQAKRTSHGVKASTLQIDDAPILYLAQAEKKPIAEIATLSVRSAQGQASNPTFKDKQGVRLVQPLELPGKRKRSSVGLEASTCPICRKVALEKVAGFPYLAVSTSEAGNFSELSCATVILGARISSSSLPRSMMLA